MGTFTERDLRIGFLQLDAGATYQAGQQSSIEILFQTKGQVTAGGEQYGPETGYEFLANEGPVPLDGRRARRIPARRPAHLLTPPCGPSSAGPCGADA